MYCRICKIALGMQKEQLKLYVWQEKSIFDFESIVCGECHKTELAVKASTDKKTMDVVHFAYISKNFGLWRSIVLLRKGVGNDVAAE